MSYLSEKLVQLRGKMTQPEMAEKCGISLRTLAKLELGESVKLITLRQISQKLGLPESKWLELLIGWIRVEIGEEDFRKLHVQPAQDSSAPWVMNDSQGDNTLMRLYGLLKDSERAEILKAMQREEVLNCLPAINRVWEKFDKDATDPVDDAFADTVDRGISESKRHNQQ